MEAQGTINYVGDKGEGESSVKCALRNQGRLVAAKCSVQGSHGFNLVSPFGLILTYRATQERKNIYLCVKSVQNTSFVRE